MNEPSLRQLTTAVAVDVSLTFGGGNPAMELLRRRFVGRRWLDAATHGLIMAVARVTPGTTVLAYCVMLGFRFHRWRGALAALAAGSVPASLVVFALTVTVARIDRYPIVSLVLAIGILVASVLVLASAWFLLKPYLPAAWRRVVLLAAVAAGLTALGATPVRVLFVAAAISAALPVRRSGA